LNEERHEREGVGGNGVMFCRLFVLCVFSFDHCAICPS